MATSAKTNPVVKSVLFDEIKTMKDYTYDEALAIARMYQDRERNADIPYSDPVRGIGQLTVNSMGIIDRSRQIITPAPANIKFELPDAIAYKDNAFVLPEEMRHPGGKWYIRQCGTRYWNPIKLSGVPKARMMLKWKRMPFFVYEYQGFEYAYRY